MSNLRVIHNNAANRATIVASTTAGALVAANLKNDRKNFVHRSTAKDVEFTITWPTDEPVGGIALPASNLTAEAEWRARYYNGADTLLHDTGLTYAAPGSRIEMINFGLQPLNANAFAFGGATKSAMWLTEQLMVRKIVLSIFDPTNKAAYIDNARLVVGQYWYPLHGAAQYGADATPVDMSKTTRSQSGDLRSDLLPMYDGMSFDLSAMRDIDRDAFSRIIKGVGSKHNIFISVLPENYNPVLEQDWMIYGKRDNSALQYAGWDNHASRVTIQGW